MSRRVRLYAMRLAHVVDLGAFTTVGEPPLHRPTVLRTIERNRDAVRFLFQAGYGQGFRRLIERMRGRFGRPGSGGPPPSGSRVAGQGSGSIQREGEPPDSRDTRPRVQPLTEATASIRNDCMRLPRGPRRYPSAASHSPNVNVNPLPLGPTCCARSRTASAWFLLRAAAICGAFQGFSMWAGLGLQCADGQEAGTASCAE